MEISRKKSLEACLAIATGLLVIYYFWRLETLLIVALVVAIVGLLLPAVARIIAFGWFKLAEGLGRINGTILLSIVFYFLLTPLALLRRMLKQDPLGLKKDEKQESYFIEREHEYQSEDLLHPW